MKTVLNVEGMSCSHCVAAVETEIGKIVGVQSVKVDLKKKTVTVKHEDTVSEDAMAQAIAAAGFELL